MPRTWFACLTIVAAFAPSPCVAAPAATTLAPVSASVLAVARTLGLEPERDRVRFLPEIIRLTQSGSEERAALLEPLRRADGGRPDATGVTAVVPLDETIWSTAIFKREVTLDRLLSAILVDRRAALLAAGLATLDDETLAYVGQAPLVLSDLYEHAVSPFAAYASSLRVRGGRVITPGADADRPVWEAVVGASADAPDRFIHALFASPGGRLAYLYGTVASFDAAKARFVLGAPTTDRAVRIDRMKALAALVMAQYGEWRLDLFPYARPQHDLALLLLHLGVDAQGRALPPDDRAFWSEVWATPDAANAAGGTPMDGAGTSVDAAWLIAATGVGNMFERGERLAQLAFAQRVFGHIAPTARGDAAAVVRALPRQKMLLLTLERMGIRDPALLALVSRQASALLPHDAGRGYWVMAQLQSALALVSRMAASGTLTRRTAEPLVRSLFAVPLEGHDRYAGGLARWVAGELAPVLPPATDLDTSVLLALAGPPAGDRARRVEWEGETYRIDFPAAEMRRLRAVREKQAGPTIDLATTLERLGAALGRSGLDLEGAAGVQRGLQEVMAVHAGALQSTLTESDVATIGIAVPRRHRESVALIAAEIERAVHARDVRRAARQAAPLHALVDVVLGQALLSTAYAADLGDPDGPALLTRNAALRHDFGFGRLDGEARARVLWAIPRQDFQPGVAWHVTGSALGLDIALARLALTRINSDRLSDVPRIPSIERDGFAVGLALMDARGLRDETRDALAASLARGAATATAAAASRQALEQAADRVHMSALRRRSLLLVAAQEPARVPELFSLTELNLLGGGPSASDLAPWGVNALPQTGCPCTHVVSPALWPVLTGRPQLPLAASAIADLNLRVAAVLADLRIPAQLTRPVLAAAIQDFLEDATASDGGDWWGLAHAARTLTRERIEDYVAAVASVGGALVPVEPVDADTREP